MSHVSEDTEFYTSQQTNVKMSISVLSKHQIPEDSRNQQACLGAWWDTSWAPSLLSGKQQNILKALPLKSSFTVASSRMQVTPRVISNLWKLGTPTQFMPESTQLSFIWSSPCSFATAAETTLGKTPAGKESQKNKKWLFEAIGDLIYGHSTSREKCHKLTPIVFYLDSEILSVQFSITVK